MKFGPIKGGGNGNNQPRVRGEIYSIDLYCSTRSTNNLTQMFGEINEMNVLVIASSIIGSIIDTFLFFSISFYATGVPWITLSLGDLAVKIFVALLMLIPFRMLLKTLKPI